jgi:vancomycin resistance protein YoaR
MLVDIPVIISKPIALDMDMVYSKVHCAPQNATYRDDKVLEIIKEKNGLDFDLQDAKSKYAALNAGESVFIQLNVVEPEIKVEDLGDILFKNLIATHTSTYDTSDADRVTNLKVAAERCNNTILYPGDEFSYNKALGPRTVAAGYRNGKIYSGGQVVDGIGGGICQISSTLYNAVLMSNLEIVERRNHQFVTSYVGAGRDATVVYGAIDFRFKNTRKYPIRITASAVNGIATVSIYGIKEENEYTFKFSG